MVSALLEITQYFSYCFYAIKGDKIDFGIMNRVSAVEQKMKNWIYMWLIIWLNIFFIKPCLIYVSI